MFTMWPASGIRTNVELSIASWIGCQTSRGALASCAP